MTTPTENPAAWWADQFGHTQGRAEAMATARAILSTEGSGDRG